MCPPVPIPAVATTTAKVRYKYLSKLQRTIDRKRSKVRARAEHAMGVLKRTFGFPKGRYRSLAKNGSRLFVAVPWPHLYTMHCALAGQLSAQSGADRAVSLTGARKAAENQLD